MTLRTFPLQPPVPLVRMTRPPTFQTGIGSTGFLGLSEGELDPVGHPTNLT